jgi:uncharacterized protein YndB with AHSA1/START domain
MNASLTSKGDRHVLRMERRFAHAVEKVWRAIAQPAELSAWWPLTIDELPLQQGAPLRFYDESGNVSAGKITALEIGRVLGFVDEGGEHEVRFELSPHERGCLLVFTHSFPSDQPPAQHATGWHLCFEMLEARLEGKPIPQVAYDAAIRRQYEEILGAGAPQGLTAREGYQPGAAGNADAHKEGNRWTLVMVRELKHSPVKVWDALTDPAQLREWAPFDADRNLGAPGSAKLTMVGGPTADAMDCTVKRADPPALLEYTWGDDLLRWELQQTAMGTRLTLHHTVDDRTWLPKVAAGWHICLDVAERALAGHPVGRIVAGDAKQVGWERLNAEYAQKFGVENTGWPEQIGT